MLESRCKRKGREDKNKYLKNMANLNKLVGRDIDIFLERENTGSITIEGAFKSINMFQHIDEVKKVIGYLMAKGLDPWKRGTKEPEKIKKELEVAKWEIVKESVPRGRSMWD